MSNTPASAAPTPGGRSFIAPAIVLDVFASALVIAGIVVYLAAPEGASAKTAIIIPGAAAVALWITGAFTLAGVCHLKLGRRAFAAGLALSILLIPLFGMPAFQRHLAMQKFSAANEQWQATLKDGTQRDTPDSRAAFFAARKAPRHDVTYLINGLWTMCGLSILAAATLVAVRPRPSGYAR